MYLSSWRTGDHPEQLLTLQDTPGAAEVAVIANAVDALPSPQRRAGSGHPVRSELTNKRGHFSPAKPGAASSTQQAPGRGTSDAWTVLAPRPSRNPVRNAWLIAQIRSVALAA